MKRKEEIQNGVSKVPHVGLPCNQVTIWKVVAVQHLILAQFSPHLRVWDTLYISNSWSSMLYQKVPIPNAAPIHDAGG